ncbi:MAG: tetratricopeptide repeat protein [Spirochaetaceae bacterium]|nr:tetratricopeptide repeat protein [Spirochaetaceae bacterium]
MFNRVLFLLFVSILSFPLSADPMEEGSSLFNRGISLYKKGDYSSSYKLLTDSIAFFEDEGKGAVEWLINAYLWAGAAAYHLQRYEEAEYHYLNSLRLSESGSYTVYQINILSALANMKYALTEYSEAGDLYLRTADIMRQSESPEGASQVFEYGGTAKVLAGEYSDALEIFERAIGNSPKDRPHNEMAGLYAMRGNCFYYLQDLNKALIDYHHSVALMEPYGSTADLTQYYGWVGKIYFDSADNENALVYFHKSLALAKELQSPEDESRILAYFGFLYSSTGEYDRAAEYYENSLKIAKTLGKREFLIAAYESLGWIYGESGNEEGLIEINQELIRLYEEINDDAKLAEACNDLGYLFYNRKEYNSAIPLFEKSAELYRKSGNNERLATVLLNLGMSYEKSGDAEQAKIYLNESLSLNLDNNNLDDAENLLGHFNLIYSKEYDYISLIRAMEHFVPIYRSENRLTELMHLTNNIGAFYYELSDYEKAIEYYREAGELAVQMEDFREQSINLHNIAQAKAALSLFNEAFELFEQALKIALEKGIDDIQGDIWNNFGELYRAWGWFEKSLSCYSKAEVIYENRGDRAGLAAVSNNIGQALRLGGDPEASIPYYNEALSYMEDKESKAIFFSNLGEAYRESGNPEEALDYYTKALQIDIEMKNLRGIQIRKNNIALIDVENGNYEQAIETFKGGLKYWEEIGSKKEVATVLRNLWRANFDLGNYTAAVDYMVDSVKIQEELRQTAKGAVRREYLDYQIDSYRDLAATYYYLEDPLNALYFLEISRGKYLLEQMNISDENAAYDWSTYSQFLENLDSKTMMISFSLTEGSLIQVIAVEQDRVTTTLSSVEEEFLNSVFSQFGPLLRRYVKDPGKNRFESILNLYRILLARPVHTRTTEDAVEFIGKYFFSKLILPFQEELSGIHQLIIVPDGILGTIPFEVLQDQNGHYLVEKYDVSYSQSLVISQMIRERVYVQDRKPMLAFGGAVYEEDSFGEDSRETDVNVIRQNVSEMIQTGGSTRGAYSGMGLGSWKNLPGTLDEVNLLLGIVPGTEIMTGADVTEKAVLNKSASGELANYKVIHFATHGIVVPEIPELSAVVLSQFSDFQGDEDGYLTMSEIARLDIKADFVNLSACETGLGKIYEGEGVVGLTQAFLIAGANALSVSLWQVSDESTMTFMTGVYTLVEENGLSYAQAISEMKRVFLKDDKYNNPFHWAPFVLYGDYEAGL